MTTHDPLTVAASLRAWIGAMAQIARGPHLATATRALVLGLVAPRPANVLLIGPPGTGKTMIAGHLAGALGARHLCVTLSPWTDLADLRGAVDVAALTSGTMRRITAATHADAPPTIEDADIATLDEIPRAAPGIRAACLSYLADRRTPDGAPCPGHLAIATANTRLTSEEDRALADRMTLRVEVPRLTDPGALGSVIWLRSHVDGVSAIHATPPSIPGGLAAVAVLREHAAHVIVPSDIARAVADLAIAMRLPPPKGEASYPDVSERRWQTAAGVLAASAALAGRDRLSWDDLLDVIPLVVDDGPESRAAIRAAVEACVPRYVADLRALDAAIGEAIDRAYRVGAVTDMRPGDADAHAAVSATLDAMLDALRPHGGAILADAENRVDDALDRIAAAHAEGMAAHAASRARSRRPRLSSAT